jgi:hypothetical protein
MLSRVMRSGFLVCLVGGCVSPVMRFGGKSAKEAQHDTMSEQAPARLATEASWKGEVTTRTIRVWADNQYRAQNVRWQRSFDKPLEFANLVLTPLFGLRLVPAYHAWERHVPGSTLGVDLEALVARDPGDDVLIVVGLTSSLPLVSATFEDLGCAHVAGRHLLVRGYADIEERKLYADAFADLLPEERELALEARRHHKTAVVLLHEIGHVLGSEHDADPDTIMNASYSHRASSFTPQARNVMLQTVNQRLGRGATVPEPTPEPRRTTAAMKPRLASDRASHLVVHVGTSGEVHIGGKLVADADIDKLLDDAFAQDRETEVLIRRSRKAPAGRLEKIVDRATAIGLKVAITMY